MLLNFVSRFTFSLKKPSIVIVTGIARETAAEAIFKVLGTSFKAKKVNSKPGLFDILEKDILIWPLAEDDMGPAFSFVRKSKKPVLLVTNIKEIPAKEYFFYDKNQKTIQVKELARELTSKGTLILNLDDKSAKEIGIEAQVNAITFGFQEGADFQATDIKESCDYNVHSEPTQTSQAKAGTNFKINQGGKVVPCWLENLFGKEQIYAALSAAACATFFGLNLVDVSQSLKNYSSVPGRQRLIKGIKNSLILDDSESATPSSMIGALETLGAIKGQRRAIAVLGDVLGIGKYSIEVHEAIGQKVIGSADLLFTVGPRAKFIAQGALMKNFPKENIFEFIDIEKSGRTLQEKIKQGDIILIDGSKEIKMEKVVEEIKQF